MSLSVIWQNILYVSRLIYFHEPEVVKIKLESEISTHHSDKCNKWLILS